MRIVFAIDICDSVPSAVYEVGAKLSSVFSFFFSSDDTEIQPFFEGCGFGNGCMSNSEAKSAVNYRPKYNLPHTFVPNLKMQTTSVSQCQ